MARNQAFPTVSEEQNLPERGVGPASVLLTQALMQHPGHPSAVGTGEVKFQSGNVN